MLNRLYVVAIDAHGQRSLDDVNRNDQAVVAIFRQKHALHSVQRSTAHSDSLPDFQEWVGPPRSRLGQHAANSLDLLVRNRYPCAADSHKAECALYAIHPRPVL